MKVTEEQDSFIRSQESRIFLNAAAGTGKTTTIAERCSHLLAQNPDDQILVTTFTRSARDTIQRKVAHLGNRVIVKTVVSLALSILNSHYSINYVGDGMEIARLVCQWSVVLSGDLLSFDYLLKNDAPITDLVVTELLDDIYTRYEDTKRELGYLSYVDVVVAARGLKSPSMNHLIVDEAQDLSPTQFAFIQQLETHNIVLAGDPLQAIFGFNGVDPNLLASLAESPEWHHMELTCSHRVPSALLPVVNGLRDAPLTTTRSGGVLSVVPTGTREQASNVADIVGVGDVVLARTNRQLDRIRSQIAVRRPQLPVSMLSEGTPDPLAVTLSTIHAYKGAESDHVVICDVAATDCGYRLSRGFNADEGTDRMLMYVATTRTNNRLTLMEIK